ncbi:putative MFS drug efflux transporter [Daldinia decipiens]|uniref:putative MFS drug efflux transporter n=1 Tax=Daldinia decipiens TaxID=326647 RepID=UPI0020C544E9|nr:putative MFS drug efflux transporter [Daldinia decipiens]KAI1662265.1 putative MFS drug efflux transporter [Daldinia decipiens]
MSVLEKVSSSQLEPSREEQTEVKAQSSITDAETANNKQSSAGDPPVRKLKPMSWFFVVFSLLAALFLFALDNTIVANIQENIIYTLGGIEKLPWISVAFALGAVATNLLWGQLYSNFESKSLFVSSVVIFEVGSALCGAAPSLDALIGGRAICGIGGMGIYLGTINMVSALTNDQERPMYLGFVGLTWGIGTILGPIIGGAFTDSSATWRWSFYINLCIGGLAAPIYLFLLPVADPHRGQSFLSRVKNLDLVGTVLSAGAITTLVMVISFGGSVYAWNSGQTIGLFVATGVLWIAFILQQRFSLLTKPQSRLFPTSLIKSWEMDILFAQMASAQVVVTIPIYFIPIYFQFAKAETALRSGVQLLPFVLPLVFAVMLNGAVMAQVGYYMPWYVVGSALALAGSVLLYTININTTDARIHGYSILTAFGVGLFSQAGFAVAQVKSAPQLLSQAVAFIGIGQISGITLALVISNSIFLNDSTDKIASILPDMPRSVVQQAVSGVGGDFFNNLTSDQRQRVLNAIIESIDNTFILVITASALSLVLSVFMKRERLFVTPPK